MFFAMKASMAGAAATFAALPVNMARLLAALEEKQQQAAGAQGTAEADGGDGGDSDGGDSADGAADSG